MFGKKQNAKSGATVVGRGDRIEGSMRIGGTLHVDGEIIGNVVAEGVVSIGPEGVIHGDLEAERISVAGRVEGRTVARGHLHMLATGVVRGETHFASLQVDRGGLLDGHTSIIAADSDAIAMLPDGAQTPDGAETAAA